MTNNNTSRLQNIILWVLFVVLPLTYTLPYASYILLAGIIVLLLFSINNGSVLSHVFIIRTGKEKIGIINLLFLLLFLWFVVVAMLVKPELDCIVRIIQIVGCFMAFNLGANVFWNKKKIELVQKTIIVILFIALIFWAVKGFPRSNYSFFFANPNTFSTILLTWILFALMGEKNKRSFFIISMVGLLLLYVSSARAAVVSFGIYLLIYFLLSQDRKKQGVFTNRLIQKWEIIFILFCVIIIATVFLYPTLMDSDIGYKLQLLSRQYTGKNFFSGRHILWEGLFSLIKDKPIMGYGLGALPGDYISVNVSSHNIFLQIALQSGLVGLGLTVFILKRIHSNCIRHSSLPFAMQSAAVLYAMILHEIFEASLTQNLLVAGLQFWFIFGMGCVELNNSTE